MKKSLLLILVLVFTFTIVGSGVWGQAQESGETEEYVLEEIMVTAEKRVENVQKVASSVAVIDGASLLEMGKISTAQILENVPNIRVTSSAATGITIRGVASHGGEGRPPSSTAVYVDQIFNGIGAGYDVSRVEVLRGPQGTLYGRSANGGVFATYTNNPVLNEFSINFNADVGKAGQLNGQGAINIPVGDKFAVRAAANYLSREHGYLNPYGGGTATKSGRIKMLFQPTDALKFTVTGTQTSSKSQSGGAIARLMTPTRINYFGTISTVNPGFWDENRMYALQADYDLGESSIVYIGSYRTYSSNKSLQETYSVQGVQRQKQINAVPGDKIYTSEIRWTSDDVGRWTWLIGSNLYHNTFKNLADNWQLSGYTDQTGATPDPDPMVVGAFIWGQRYSGKQGNISIFTEETYALKEDLRVTAGLRYDRTRIWGQNMATFNMNINGFGNSLRPDDIKVFWLDQVLHYSNITYKLRFEYDLTPNNMLYALTSTGFLPGNVQINANMVFDPVQNKVTAIWFNGLPLDEEKLTAYEIGSKNQFLGRRLQLNGAFFYYNYEGFRNITNVATTGQSPMLVIITTPLRMIGAELDMIWLPSAADRVTFSFGLLDAKITDFPVTPLYGNSRKFMYLDKIANNPPKTANIGYDHTFSLASGAFLVPRISVRWTAGQYVTNLTQTQVNNGALPYAWQKAFYITDIGASYTSPDGMYSISGYIRNFFDTEYKNGVSLNRTNPFNSSVTPGDPRVWGVNFNLKF